PGWPPCTRASAASGQPSRGDAVGRQTGSKYGAQRGRWGTALSCRDRARVVRHPSGNLRVLESADELVRSCRARSVHRTSWVRGDEVAWGRAPAGAGGEARVPGVEHPTSGTQPAGELV